MRVVFGSNVWIAALVASGLSRDVVDEALAVCEVFSSPYILWEVDRVLERKIRATAQERHRAEKWLKSVAVMVHPPAIQNLSCPDPKDVPILELVLAIHADFLVTGDKALWNLKEIRGIKIISPTSFWSLAVCQRFRNGRSL